MGTTFDWFSARMVEVAGDITVGTSWDSRLKIQGLALDLMETLHNGTSEDIIEECAKIGVYALSIAEKARFGGI